MPVPSSSPELVLALLAESAKKSRVCWLTFSGEDARADVQARAPRLVWHAWYDGALLVLSGEDQRLPGIDSATTAEVVMRSKDTGARLVGWTGTVEVVDPDDERWETHAAALLAVRLNLPDPAAALDAWRADATIVRIVPADAAQR